MSQEKVDRYKQEKANRNETMKKQKRERFLLRFSATLVGLVIVGWIGISAFNKFYEAPVKSYEIEATAVSEYLVSLNEVE